MWVGLKAAKAKGSGGVTGELFEGQTLAGNKAVTKCQFQKHL